MDDNSVERLHDHATAYRNDGLTGFAKGAAFGAGLLWVHDGNPRIFWRAVWYVYLLASFFWIWGALTPSLPTAARVTQGVCAAPAVLILFGKILRRAAS